MVVKGLYLVLISCKEVVKGLQPYKVGDLLQPGNDTTHLLVKILSQFKDVLSSLNCRL